MAWYLQWRGEPTGRGLTVFISTANMPTGRRDYAVAIRALDGVSAAEQVRSDLRGFVAIAVRLDATCSGNAQAIHRLVQRLKGSVLFHEQVFDEGYLDATGEQCDGGTWYRMIQR